MKKLMTSEHTIGIKEKLSNTRFSIGATAYRQVKSHWNPMNKTPPFTALRIPVTNECEVFDLVESTLMYHSSKSAFRQNKT